MAKTEQNQNSSCHDQNCSCGTGESMSVRSKVIIIAVIVLTASLVLGNSLYRKSHSKDPAPQHPEYSNIISKTSAAGTLSPDTAIGPDSAAPSSVETLSIAPLASFESLNTVAQHVDGVFILLAGSEEQKTPAIQQEIGAAMKAITAKGIRMSVFQLATTSPDFAGITAQIAPPGVLAVFKGRGMRAVQGKDISETKLLQACLAAMQPSSCCPAGGSRVCK